MKFNLILLPHLDTAGLGASVIGESEGYANALLNALEFAEGMEMRPLDAPNVAVLRQYSPKQAWALYDNDGEWESLLAIQEVGV